MRMIGAKILALRRQLTESKNTLQSQTGYPFGSTNARVQQAARQIGVLKNLLQGCKNKC